MTPTLLLGLSLIAWSLAVALNGGHNVLALAFPLSAGWLCLLLAWWRA